MRTVRHYEIGTGIGADPFALAGLHEIELPKGALLVGVNLCPATNNIDLVCVVDTDADLVERPIMLCAEGIPVEDDDDFWKQPVSIRGTVLRSGKYIVVFEPNYGMIRSQQLQEKHRSDIKEQVRLGLEAAEQSKAAADKKD